ncbi:hypothetical protein [Sulfuricystis multivorans]|uniref:hypothetical protein n=1 Tax=Sulfuricystis multivorans TaxID=2211108 RepID=UPI000F81C605|nr:hypothetical protein [Sulfuricystis multivorans]
MPRPVIFGTVIRQIDMHHSSPGKDKDYRITIAQDPDGLCRVYTEYGPACKLQNGKEQTKKPTSVILAEVMANDLRDRKIKQTDSYAVISDQRFSAAATSPAKPALAQTPPQAPVRKLISADSLSPASRAALAAIF